MSLANWFDDLSGAAFREVSRVLSSPGELVSLLLVPVLWCVLFVALSGGGLMRSLPFGLVDLDNSPESASLVRSLSAIPSIRLSETSRASAMEAARAGRSYGFIVIPEGWSGTRSRSWGKSVELHISRTTYSISAQIELDVKRSVIAWASEKSAARAAQLGGLDGASRMVSAVGVYEIINGNRGFNYRIYLNAALVPMLIGLAAILACVGSLVREWRDGTLRRDPAARRNPSAFVIGKVIPWILLYLLYLAAWIAWFAGVDGNVPMGSVVPWLAASFVYIAGLASMGILFAALAPQWSLALVFAIVSTAPTIPYTGFSFPADNMGPLATFLSNFLPLNWFLKTQAAVWALGSPPDHVAVLLAKSSLFILVPALVGLPLLSSRIRRWIALEEKGAGTSSASRPSDTMSGRAVFLETVKRSVFGRHTFLILTGGVAFYLLLYGLPYNNEQVTELPVAVVDLDGTAASRELIRNLDASSKIKVVGVLPSEEKAREGLLRQRFDIAILIPKNYGHDIGDGTSVNIGTYGNGSYPAKVHNVASAVLTVIQGMASRQAARLMLLHGADPGSISRSAIAAPVLVTQNLFNTQAGYGTFLVAIVCVIIVQSVVIMGITLSFGDWLRVGDIRPFLWTALSRPSAFLSLLFAYAFLALFWLLYTEGFYFAAIEYNTFANPVGTIVLSILYASAVSAMGLLITLLFGGDRSTTPFVVLSSAPSVFLSGTVFPFENFSSLAKAAALALPSTPAINGLLAVSQNGASWSGVSIHAAHLLLLAVFYGSLAMLAARRRAAARPGL